MSKRKSKLKAMAATGNPWAVATLAKMQAEGRAAALHGLALQRKRWDEIRRINSRRRVLGYRESDALAERMARDRD